MSRTTPAQSRITEALASAPAHCQAALVIDLDAVGANYRQLRTFAGNGRDSGARAAAVVKADGYGLGAGAVATHLAAQGCETFFVATPSEAVSLRTRLGPMRTAVAIYVLDGLLPGSQALLTEHQLRPVLGSLAEIEAWAQWQTGTGLRLASAIHVDTGMNRLGLPPGELSMLAGKSELVAACGADLLISHLACADEAGHPMNDRQLASFRQARALFPALPASLANSAGVFLGAGYHFDLLRPGIALYGGNPLTGAANPMQPVLYAFARILQLRDCAAGETVGYGAGQHLSRASRIATIGLGYADGFLRQASASDQRAGPILHLNGKPAPIVGRVSMDLITIDVTDFAPDRLFPGAWVEVLGSTTTVDEIAGQAGTIGYEVLTRLGNRFHRIYLD